MDEIINELMQAANLLRTVKIDGEYWFTMIAIYNTIIQTAQKLQKVEVEQDEPGNDTADA